MFLYTALECIFILMRWYLCVRQITTKNISLKEIRVNLSVAVRTWFSCSLDFAEMQAIEQKCKFGVHLSDRAGETHRGCMRGGCMQVTRPIRQGVYRVHMRRVWYRLHKVYTCLQCANCTKQIWWSVCGPPSSVWSSSGRGCKLSVSYYKQYVNIRSCGDVIEVAAPWIQQ